jgi:hypothetical protein
MLNPFPTANLSQRPHYSTSMSMNNPESVIKDEDPDFTSPPQQLNQVSDFEKLTKNSEKKALH